MATYVNNLRLKEITPGDESGTWGTSLNLMLELIGEAMGYGTEAVFTSDANATATVADGLTDSARSMYFKVTSSTSLTATRTLTMAPSTVSRVMFIENATSGSQSITVSQGSGTTVTIPSGGTKMVYLDGGGATANVVDGLAAINMASLTLASGVTVTAILDEDDMASDSDTALVTQQSAKAYTDSVGTTVSVTSSSAIQTFALDDGNTMQVLTGSTDRAWTVPPNSSVAFPTGTIIMMAASDTAEIQVTEGSGVTINSASGNANVAAGGIGVLVKIDTDEWMLGGDIVG